VNEDHKVAEQCERAIHKASQLLISYAQIAFTEEEINKMKKQYNPDDSYDISFEIP